MTARAVEYHRAHRAEKFAYNRKYRQDNPEKERAKNKKYNEAHREELRLNRNRRRAREQQALGSYTFLEWEARLKEYNYTCAWPGCVESQNLTIDHIIPLSKGGTNYIWNIQPLCGHHNASKHDSIIDIPTVPLFFVYRQDTN